MFVQKFKEVWKKLGATTPWASTYERVLSAYLKPHRAHHNMEQVGEFLDELDGYALVQALPHREEAQAVGIWRSIADDQDHSAAVCVQELRDSGVPREKYLRISEGIIGAKHARGQNVEPAMWPAMDADLAILGKLRVRYNRYRKDIEYELRYDGALSEIEYLKIRLDFLQSILGRHPYIYRTPYFGTRYDVRARANMEYEKQILQARLQRL